MLVRLKRTWADEIAADTIVSRQAVSMKNCPHPAEERDQSAACPDEPQRMGIVTEGVDAQDEAAGQMDLDVEMDQARNGCAIQGILGIDLENAYGRMYRSQALKGARHRAPRTAAMAATQWSAGANRIWCREGAEWRSLWTERGGWQGARSAQLLFAMSLEEAVDNTPVMAEPGVTRVGLQDDMYAVAQPAKLKVMLEHLQIALQACGHRLRMHKCKVWCPGWDDTPDDGLPQEAVALLQLIPRERGGLVLLASGCAR